MDHPSIPNTTKPSVSGDSKEPDHANLSKQPETPTIVSEKLGQIKKSNNITLRFIRSCHYANIRTVVLNDLDLDSTSPHKLLKIAQDLLSTNKKLKPYQRVKPEYFDSLRLYSVPGGAKTSDLVINFNDPDTSHCLTYPTNLHLPLSALGVVHEAEISVYNQDDYNAYKANPVRKF